jgi:aspartate racemase
LKVLVPDEKEREWIDSLIFRELCAGIFRDDSRLHLAGIVERLAGEGAEAVILGCTELPLILNPGNSPLPVLDTMKIHAESAVKESLR